MKSTKNITRYDLDIFHIARSRILGQNDGASVIIPHVCNNINLFGAGFAACLADRYPVVKENFHMLGNKSKLGYVQYITVEKDEKYNHKLIIANMIAQNRTISPNNRRPLNYEYLIKCMIDVRNHVIDFQKMNDAKLEIHCPKFGSGLAGGDWKFISKLMEDIWYEIPIFVYVKGS